VSQVDSTKDGQLASAVGSVIGGQNGHIHLVRTEITEDGIGLQSARGDHEFGPAAQSADKELRSHLGGISHKNAHRSGAGGRYGH
jgi:hypothetical protein